MSDPHMPASGDAALGRVLETLSKRQRRVILVTLRQSSPVHQSDVMLRGSDVDDIELRLHHVHLPKLEETGYIEWDRETRTISEGPRFDEIAPVLDLMAAHADDLPHEWP